MNNLRCCISRSEVDSYMQPEMLLNHTCSLEEILQIMCVKIWQSRVTNSTKIKPNQVGISYRELQPHERASLWQFFSGLQLGNSDRCNLTNFCLCPGC